MVQPRDDFRGYLSDLLVLSCRLNPRLERQSHLYPKHPLDDTSCLRLRRSVRCDKLTPASQVCRSSRIPKVCDHTDAQRGNSLLLLDIVPPLLEGGRLFSILQPAYSLICSLARLLFPRCLPLPPCKAHALNSVLSFFQQARLQLRELA